jgi:rSAM/selenodomain-associated transferase 1
MVEGNTQLDDRCLLFLVKDAAHGAVKTRLASVIGEHTARDLYKTFIHDMLLKLEKESFTFFICVHPENALDRLKLLLGEKYQYMPQRGDDLGQRMEHCFRNAFSKDFRRVIVMGSDLPDLPAEIIGDAFRFLNTLECVIGPSVDGGYYLIGFRSDSFLPETFRGLPWGTDTVLRKTTDILRNHRLRTHLLQSWRDIDTVEDLRHFFEKNKDTPICPRTMAYLHSSKLPFLTHLM